MNSLELIALIVSGVGVLSFAIVFTVLYLTYTSSAVNGIKEGKSDLDLIDDTVYNNMNGKKKHRKVLRVVKQALFYLTIAILVSFLVFSLYGKFTTGIAMVGGRGVIVVASGSMSIKNPANPYLAGHNNQLNTYDMIVLEKVESENDLALYDVISYRNDEGINVIHRIVNIENTPDGIRFVTRGDSNNADDKYKPYFKDVMGRYTDTRVPYVGVFIMFLQSYAGILTVLGVIYCLVMIEFVSGKIYDAQERRIEILQSIIDFKDDTEFDDDLDYHFVETIIYKNQHYKIDVNEENSLEHNLKP